MKKNFLPKSLYTFIIILGTISISSQIILVHQFLMLAEGNELIISITLGCCLLFSGIGSIVAIKFPRPVFFLIFVALLLSVALPAAVFSTVLIRPALGLTPTEFIGFSALIPFIGLITAPVFFLTGAVFPLSFRTINILDTLRRPIYWAYFFDAMGCGIGALVVGLFLVPVLNPLSLSFFLSGSLLLCAYFASKSFPGSSTLWKTVQFFLLLLLLADITAILSDKPRMVYKNQQWGSIQFIEDKTTRFGYLDAVRIGDQMSIYKNNQLFTTSGFNESAWRLTEAGFLHSPQGKQILVIGKITGGIPELILKHNIQRLDLVTLDKQSVDFILNFFSCKKKVLDQPGIVNQYFEDERRFLQKTTKTYDLIYISTPPPLSLADNRFYTEKFYRLLYKSLSPEGIAVCEIPSSRHHLTKENLNLLACIDKTINRVFPKTVLIPGDTCIFLISKKPSFQLALPPGKNQDGFRAELYNYISGFDSGMHPDFLKQIVTAHYPQIFQNRDHYPVALVYSLIHRHSLFNDELKMSEVFNTFLQLPVYIYYIIILILILPFIFFHNKPQSGLLLVSISMGLSAMTYQILIMFKFQIEYGNLFYQLGLLIPCFMIGLSIGAICFYHLNMNKNTRILSLLFIVLLLNLFFPVIMNLTTSTLDKPIYYSGLSVFAGVINGILFLAIIEVWKKIFFLREEAIGGAVFAFDLVGASIGAIALSPIFIPLLGIWGTCKWLMIFNTCVFIFCFYHLLRKN